MRLLLALTLFLLTAVPTYAAGFPDDAPHHGHNNVVRCEADGLVAYAEGENNPKHAWPADEVEYMKGACVRELRRSGQGTESYWAPLTEADWQGVKFKVWN